VGRTDKSINPAATGRHTLVRQGQKEARDSIHTANGWFDAAVFTEIKLSSPIDCSEIQSVRLMTTSKAGQKTYGDVISRVTNGGISACVNFNEFLAQNMFRLSEFSRN